MQAALDGIITIDHEGRMIELNAAAEKIFAHNRAKLIGENVLEIVPPSFRSWFQNGLANCFVGDKGPAQGSRIEMPALRADGSRFSAEFTITRIKLAGRPMFTLYIRDITQQKRAEAELRALPQRIIKAQEAERSRIAHELHDGINQLIASVKMRLQQSGQQPAGAQAGGAGNSRPLRPAAGEGSWRKTAALPTTCGPPIWIISDWPPPAAVFAARSSREPASRFNAGSAAPAKRLPPVTELHLFRIVQEAINNIEKHAQAEICQAAD